MRQAIGAVVLFLHVIPAQVKESGPHPFDPTDRYEVKQVEGWTVLVNKGFLELEPELADRTLTLLGHQLYQVGRRVPADPLKKL